MYEKIFFAAISIVSMRLFARLLIRKIQVIRISTKNTEIEFIVTEVYWNSAKLMQSQNFPSLYNSSLSSLTKYDIANPTPVKPTMPTSQNPQKEYMYYQFRVSSIRSRAARKYIQMMYKVNISRKISAAIISSFPSNKFGLNTRYDAKLGFIMPLMPNSNIITEVTH